MGHTSEMTAFLNLHEDQLISSGVPEYFWQTLHTKLVNQTFNTSEHFELLKVEQDGEENYKHHPSLILRALKDINKCNAQHIYLIDHAWTYKIHAKQQLLEHVVLRNRLCNIFNIDLNLDKKEISEKLFDNLWKINNFYSISNAKDVEDRLPIWFVMDEVGTAVTHSDHPNCRIVPFIYINDQITTYSILFPIEDIKEADIITRDFAEGITESIRREAVLLPWVPKSFESIDVDPPMPDEEYFLSGHVKESLPDLSKLEGKKVLGNVLKLYSQYSLINSNMSFNKFAIVDNPDDADILWYTEHFKDFKKLSDSPEKFINQFPFEYVLTVKDLLCITCRRKQRALNWLPTSYNLVTEIGYFVSYFQKRDKEGLDNFWIVKPYNLARSLDIHITNNLDYILRVSLTGPKIVQKYITNPVLFYRPECNGKVKFDIRYVLLLKSVKPLKAYVYKHFFLRFANNPFALNDFEDYEKHFTVMNYTENADLKHMKCTDFLLNWMVQYPDYEWDTVEKLILIMLKDILECATIEEPPCGIAHNPQSRALYAADIMLEWTEDKEIEPKILEINFTPDCKRACDYYPKFYEDIFRVLFFNESVDTIIPL